METLKDKIIATQDEYIAYLTRAIKSESIIEAITAGVRSSYESELSRLKDEGEDKLTCTDKCRWFNIGYGHCNFCIRQVKEHDCRDNFEPAERSDKLTAEDVLKDFISKCRDYSCNSSDISKKRYSFTVVQLCELMEAYHSQFVGEKVKVSKKRKGYYCSICHDNPVDAENGYDTCQECLSKQ